MVYLNEPNKEIEHEEGNNDYLAYSVGQMQGWRLNMVRLENTISLFLMEQASDNFGAFNFGMFGILTTFSVGGRPCCKCQVL